MALLHRRYPFALIAGLGLAGVGFSTGKPPKPPVDRSAQVLATGLKLWRKPGAIQNGAACATCHSPDGIELAYYNFDDANIVRRARAHLSVTEAKQLALYVHALRKKYGFVHPLDPIVSRPLQPGGAVLPGNSPSDRDLKFGKELEKKLPRLFGPPIDSISSAIGAEKELLALDPRKLKIGISLNRISEDIAHGNEHSTIAQWFPESPPAVPAAQLAGWYREEDKYLADPTPERLHALVQRHNTFVDPFRYLGLITISIVKYRSLLVLQDRIRHGTMVPKTLVAPDVRGPGIPNLIWEVGDLARQFSGRDPRYLGMNADLQSKKLAGPDIESQLLSLRLSWMWAGWLSDQGLFRSGGDDKTSQGLWLTDALLLEGPYPIHNVYSTARRQAVISNDASSWSALPTQRRRIWDYAALRLGHRDTLEAPKSGEQARLYNRFLCNCYRMNLRLLERDLKATHLVWIKLNSKLSAHDMVTFIDRVEPGTRGQTDRLKKEVTEQIDSARDLYMETLKGGTPQGFVPPSIVKP